MSNRYCSPNTLLLEDFNIKEICENFPEKKIGVSVSQVYIMIAKLSNSPKRNEDFRILVNALNKYSELECYDEPKYIAMDITDVKKCFRNQLSKLPKKAFMLID
ncbi:hypothetical protein [Acetobacterium malicum]|uniref:hypothetical protein n=1 Tax=Acetobacterium malicum TaxID=52692 RepID=UPI00047871EE|nr:hypothetical protein [Acetobacterium dehalogenans]